MTSRTGPSRGFTLIELLVVISIILVLVATLVTAAMTVRKKVMVQRTRGLLVNLKTAMTAYYQTYRSYPPDGYDFEVEILGRPIQGSRCLVYYLMTPRPTTVKATDGTERTRMRDPILTDSDVPDASLTFSLNDMESREEVPEIIDGFEVPFLYDRVKKADDFSKLGTDGHPDPRGPDKDSLTLDMGRYQIWSRGSDGRKATGDAGDDIKSWESQ